MRMLLVLCAVAAFAIASAVADMSEDMVENQASSSAAPTRRTRPTIPGRTSPGAGGSTRPTGRQTRPARTTEAGATRPARTSRTGPTRATRPARTTQAPA